MNEIIFEKSLFAKDNSESIRFWKIKGVKSPDAQNQIDIRIMHGVLNGEINYSEETISEGLANRTIEEQALLRMNARIEKKIRSGYVESLEQAKSNKRVNALGLVRPMLAKVYENEKDKIDFSKGVFIQKKYNGHRCLVTNIDGKNIAYTRGGKLIETIPHILEEIDIPEGATIDGELYCHEVPFQTVSSWIKKNQEETKKLTYIIYDVVLDSCFSMRLHWLRNKIIYLHTKYLHIAETYKINDLKDCEDERDYYISEGFEGAMIRIDGYPYEDGKKSKSLIKMKKFFDAEFKVVDIYSSGDDWAILTCETEDGKRFGVSAPGSIYEKTKVLKEKDLYIGRYVNVEYSGLTKDGKLFQPVAQYFRDPE